MRIRISRENLRPLANVEPYPTRAYQWAALSDNPQFLIDGGSAMASKRALFFGQIKHDGLNNTCLTLYFDTGNGFSIDQSVCISPDDKGLLSCIIDIPTKLENLRIDPIARAGRFSLKLSVSTANAKTRGGVFSVDMLRTRQVIYRLASWALATFANYKARWKEASSVSLLPGAYRSSVEKNNRSRYFQRWHKCTKIHPSQHAEYRKNSRVWSQRPLISVLMHIEDADEEKSLKSISSVKAQDYENWELFIVMTKAMESHSFARLKAHVREDGRIKVNYSPQEKNTNSALNAALASATGEYVAILDCGDLLAQHALYRVAECIESASPDMLYSDEVLVSDSSGDILNLVFRPAFSLELLRSNPYIHHLVSLRASLLREIGGFNEAPERAMYYDLVLRAAEHAKLITHIPDVLYFHAVPKDCDRQTDGIELIEALKAILAAHLVRCGLQAQIEGGTTSKFLNVRYPLTQELRVAIVIPTKNHGELLRMCLESIQRTVDEVTYDIVVIDHESDEPVALDYLSELRKKHTVLRYEGPFNFSTINNWAVRQLGAQYTHYLLCNNDIEAISPGWLERMMELGQQPDVGIVGAKLYFSGGQTIQHAGVCIGMLGTVEHFGKFIPRQLPNTQQNNPGYLGSLVATRELSAVTGACLLIRRDVFDKIKGLDESFDVGYGDIDLCLRTREVGYRVLFCPHAELIHRECFTRGKTFSGDPHPEDTARFMNRWQSYIADGDPFYNPNLSLKSMCWEIAMAHEHIFLAPRTMSNGRSRRVKPPFTE